MMFKESKLPVRTGKERKGSKFLDFVMVVAAVLMLVTACSAVCLFFAAWAIGIWAEGQNDLRNRLFYSSFWCLAFAFVSFAVGFGTSELDEQTYGKRNETK